MTVLLALLALFNLLALLRGRISAARSLLIASLAVLFATGSGLVPSMLLTKGYRPTRPNISWRNHSRIVVLGDGTTRPEGTQPPGVPLFGSSRIVAGAEAYIACRTRQPDCKVVVSGGDPQRHGTSEARVYAEALAKLGVPASDLVVEPASRNTWENARNTAALVRVTDPMIIVTSGYQIPRALLYFQHFRNDVVALPSDQLTVDFSAVPSSLNILTTDILLHERIGVVRYYLYNDLGWNPPKRV